MYSQWSKIDMVNYCIKRLKLLSSQQGIFAMCFRSCWDNISWSDQIRRFYTYLLFIELNTVHKQKVFATSCIAYQLKNSQWNNLTDWIWNWKQGIVMAKVEVVSEVWRRKRPATTLPVQFKARKPFIRQFETVKKLIYLPFFGIEVILI